ncbi:MAG: M48 family metalloprotease [Cyanobacteria bacterium J06639_16]
MCKIRKFLLAFLLGLGICLSPFSHLPGESTDCFAAIAEADQLYAEGDRTTAEQLYRQCKQPFPQQDLATYFPEPLTDSSQLSPAAQVHWRGVQDGLERDQENLTFVSLDLLIQEAPDFAPAYGLLAEALQRYDRQTEALEALEQAATLFPYDPDIARARTIALSNAGQPMEASMAARVFSMVNPAHPEREEFVAMADENLDTFKTNMRSQYLATGVLGIIGNVVLGSGSTLSNALDSVQIATMLVEGEDTTGTRLANATIEDAKANDTLVDDPVILEYVDTIGQDIAAQMGRDEFNYEFNVIDDNALNAFALPGGKVFINTGSILAANSEAELAGLIGHEVAHAVLSHGYQRIATNGLLSAADNALPLGNLAGLASLDFSRQNERQADILGTRAIAGFGYAADGLRNFFVTLNNQSGSSQPEYLSTHPAPASRISYLEALIQQNGYNRYSYEGVEEHNRIQQRIRELLES